MAKSKIPATKSSGSENVAERLAALGKSQRTAVLATVGGGAPYTSLVAFALTPDVGGLVFATPRDTAKYRNMREDPAVSLLIDNRANTRADTMDAEAITILGTAKPVRRGNMRDELAGALKAKHPELAGFIDAQTTALMLVEISKAVHVGRFQVVSVWEPGG